MSARMPSRGDPVLDLAARVAQLERELKEMHARVLTVGGRRLIVHAFDTTFEKADFAWLRLVRARVLGAGGGGGAATVTGANQWAAGAGGASGNYAESFLHVDDLPDIVTITIGDGGAGGVDSAGDAGTISAFDTGVSSTWVRAGGGAGGARGLAASSIPRISLGGVPSTTVDGQIEMRGEYGHAGLGEPTAGYAKSGHGAPAPWGGGGARGNLRVSSGAIGTSAAGPGGGGAGGANGPDETPTNGGSGRNGLIVIELFG